MNMNIKRRVLGGAIAAWVTTVALPTSCVWAQEKVIRVTRAPVGAFQGLYIAEQQGYFKEAGIKVEINVGGAPPQNIAQLQAGQTDIIMSGPFDVITASAQGLPVVAILNIQDQGATATTGLLIPPNGSVKSVADLKGKAIGITGGVQSAQGLMLLRAIEKASLRKGDVRFVNLPFDAVIESAERGAVNAIAPVGLFFSLAQSRGFSSIDGVYEEIKGAPAVVFASSKSYIAANEDAVTAFASAMTKAYEYGNAHPDVVREIDSAQTKMPPDYIKTRYIAPCTGIFQREIWSTSVSDMARFGFIPKIPAEADYIWAGAPK